MAIGWRLAHEHRHCRVIWGSQRHSMKEKASISIDLWPAESCSASSTYRSLWPQCGAPLRRIASPSSPGIPHEYYMNVSQPARTVALGARGVPSEPRPRPLAPRKVRRGAAVGALQRLPAGRRDERRRPRTGARRNAIFFLLASSPLLRLAAGGGGWAKPAHLAGRVGWIFLAT